MVSLTSFVIALLLGLGAAAPSSHLSVTSASPSKSRPSQTRPASTSRLASGTGTATCPPFTTGTYTKTSTEYEATTPPSNTTITDIVYSEPPQVTTTRLLVDTSTTRLTTAVVTSTAQTFLIYELVTIPANKTVYQPTRPGFTPLLCQSDYYEKTVTTTTTQTDSAIPITTSTSYITTTGTFTTIIYTSTTVTTSTFLGTATAIEFATSTTTSTRRDPTRTIYAACATNNISPKFPGGNSNDGTSYLNNGNPLAGGSYDMVPALDAEDCCGLCQGRTDCVASYWYGRLINYPPCQLITKNATANPVCNPSFKGAVVGSYPVINAYGSNGACGQMTFSR